MTNTRGGRAGIGVALFAFAFALARVAQCQVVNEDSVLKAVAAKERAIDSGRNEDWQTAMRLFRDAHQTHPTAATAYEVGVAASTLHQDDLAFEAYSEALKLGLSGVAHEKATSFVSDHRPRLARVYPRCPAGSQILIQGIERGQAPLGQSIVAFPGVTHIECRSANGPPQSREVTLVAGGEQIVVLDAAKEQASSAEELPNIERGESALPVAPDTDRRMFERALSRDISFSSSPVGNTVDGPLHLSAVRASQQSQHRFGRLFAGSGLSMLVWSGYLMLRASHQIRDGRQALANFCAVQSDGPDTCRHAKAGRQAQAQGYSDSIATWKAVRAVSWVGAGLGAAATLVGAGMITGLVGATGQRRPSAQLAFSQTGVALEIRATFE